MVILRVDDDDDDLQLFAEAIKHIDPTIECITMTTALSALDFLKADVLAPDFIFIDINMPVMDGKKCLQEIKKIEKCKFTPIVMLSTTASAKEITEYKELGADFLAKPNTYTGLIEAVRKCIFSRH
ncbi:hypothetical protein HMI54_014105 [Coelomomyces lativittatus]|nr:hypothetical protein HMI54_014105 [Coelomomyces lativittatus]